MNQVNVLTTFTATVQRFADHRRFAARAQELAPSFSPVVVERVVRDHTARAEALVSTLLPLLADTETLRTQLDVRLEATREQAANLALRLEEHALRALLQDPDQPASEDAETQDRADLDATQDALVRLTEERDATQDALDTWYSLAQEAGLLQDDAPVVEVEAA